MPDILCTTGVIVVASSLTILAKESVLPFGLPILVALLVAKECRSAGRFLTLSIAWGSAPILGLAAWISVDRFSPPTPWTILQTAADRNDAGLLDPVLYVVTAACLFPFGVGVLYVRHCVRSHRQSPTDESLDLAFDYYRLPHLLRACDS
jgi:hypothetical protein